jgi:hypothetical protein
MVFMVAMDILIMGTGEDIIVLGTDTDPQTDLIDQSLNTL